MLAQPESIQQVVQRWPADAEQIRGLGQVAIRTRQRTHDLARSALSRASRRFRGVSSACSESMPRSRTWMTGPSVRITARLITFSSSRTLPGHR